MRDTLQASRIIIGTNSRWAEEMLIKIYEPFNLPIVSVSRRSAEMIKYAIDKYTKKLSTEQLISLVIHAQLKQYSGLRDISNSLNVSQFS